MSADAPAWSVQVLDLGQSLIRGPQAFWNDEWDEMVPLAFNAVLARTADRTVLINTSPPETTEMVERLFPRMRYLHDAPAGDLHREPRHQMVAALAAHGLTPDDVDTVILTPFELYTTGTLHLFRKAEIYLSRTGWVHFHTIHDHPHDKRWRKFPQSTLVDLVTESWDRVRLLDDEHEVASGLRTWWAGTHHRESVVVEIDTPAGTVAVSDAFFYYANVEDGRMLGLNESMDEGLVAYARTLRTAQHIVPIHEPRVFERYPDGRIG